MAKRDNFKGTCSKCRKKQLTLADITIPAFGIKGYEPKPCYSKCRCRIVKRKKNKKRSKKRKKIY